MDSTSKKQKTKMDSDNVVPPRVHRRSNKPRSIIVSKLPDSARAPHVTRYFGNYGDVKDMRFKYNYKGPKDPLQYTSCCTVEFESAKSVKKVMRVRNHEILSRHVDVEIFMGVNSHKHLLEKGRWRLWIKGGLPGGIPEPEEDHLRLDHMTITDEAYEYLHREFGRFGYNRCKLYRNFGIFNGQAKLRFVSEAECHKALNHVECTLGLQGETWMT